MTWRGLCWRSSCSELRKVRFSKIATSEPWSGRFRPIQQKVAYKMLGPFIGLRGSWRRARTRLSKALPNLKAERNRTQKALQQNEFYLSEGQRLARMGSWAFDADGFSYWSPGLCQVYGLDPR